METNPFDTPRSGCPSEFRRAACKRCGGTGWQESGRYWNWVTRQFQEEGDGFCLECHGSGYMGLVPKEGNIS